jgi:hypothetical protein
MKFDNNFKKNNDKTNMFNMKMRFFSASVKIIATCFLFNINASSQGFSPTSIQWNIPDLGENYDDQIYADNFTYSVLDFNGDGKPDLIDPEDNNSGEVWISGLQKYWKVYLNTAIPTGLSEKMDSSINFSLYPNPFSNTLIIHFLSSKLTLYNFVIIDIQGQIKFQEAFNSEKQIFNLNLPSGLYFYRITNDKQETIGQGKLIRQ